MNELQNFKDSNPSWKEVFDSQDFMLAESLVRLHGRYTNVLWAPDASEALLLLLLVKANRLEHAALPLDPTEFAAVVKSELWATDEDSPEDSPDVASILEVLGNPQSWHGALLESVELSEPVTAIGPPLVLGLEKGVPRYLYLRRLAFSEDRIAAHLIGSLREPSDSLANFGLDIDGSLARFKAATFENYVLHDPAVNAFNNLLHRKISVLTGGPGTGKTKTIAVMLAALGGEASALGKSLTVARCAPTAKAAIRMSQAIDASFATFGEESHAGIHFDKFSGSVQKLLRMHEETDSSNRKDLDVDILIVDEVSMLDMHLMDQLLISASEKTHILLVGDPNQLISVRVGAILRDIITLAHGGDGPLGPLVSKLEVSFRSVGGIDDLANAINNSDVSAVEAAFGAHPEALRLVAKYEDVAADALTWAKDIVLAATARDEATVLELLESQMILCGLRRGPGSVKWWNEEMRQSLISARLIEPDNRLPIGAPVLVTKNENQVGRNPSDSLNNGDLGAVVEGADGPEVIFAGEPTARRRRTTEINQFDLGWSLTIHKSQGSEYKKVIVSLPMKNSSFVSKELLYTAVTRAKHEVTVVGSIESISKIIANEASRVGGLQARLEAKLA